MVARPIARLTQPAATAVTVDAESSRRAALAIFALVLALLTAFVGFAASAHAQATRLDAVFERLRTTSDVREAKRLEQQILEAWNHSGDVKVDSIFTTGNGALEKGDLDLAFAAFDEVVRRAPGFAEGYNKRANVQYLRGNYAAAMRDVSRTLELERRHYGALLGLGMIFEAEKSDDLAMKMFETALSINPNVEWARDKLRQLRDKRGIRLT
jgi:tetratricopeptide (TPR) repeat protein